MQKERIALIGAPSSAGARRTGQEGAPEALRRAGLVDRLERRGLEVEDLGDLPRVAFRPDAVWPQRQNLHLVVGVARQVAERVERALADGLLPLVLGGDCSLGLGVVAGALSRHDDLGLLYFDADLDLNTPETTPSGAFDGMVMAHLLGRGAPELATLGPRHPLLEEDDVTLFGYDVESGWIDPYERRCLEASRMACYPLERVRSDAAGVARQALARLEARSAAVVVHFDVDVMSFAAVDVEHPNGLEPDDAMEALGVFLASPSCTAVVVTELNVERDPDRSQTAWLAEGLAGALGAGLEGVA